MFYTSLVYVVGLIGNFGTGKSTVANILAKKGAYVIDADKVGHHLLETDNNIKRELVTSFGSDILNNAGEIDRSKLAKLAFENKSKTEMLNAIMKDRIKKVIESKITECRNSDVKVLIVEGALLKKEEWRGIIDEFWMTYAPVEIIIDRLVHQRGFNEADVTARLKAQMTQNEMLEQADEAINTDCSLGELKHKIDILWNKLLKKLNPNA